jgi:hypothetical protein
MWPLKDPAWLTGTNGGAGVIRLERAHLQRLDAEPDRGAGRAALAPAAPPMPASFRPHRLSDRDQPQRPIVLVRFNTCIGGFRRHHRGQQPRPEHRRNAGRLDGSVHTRLAAPPSRRISPPPLALCKRPTPGSTTPRYPIRLHNLAGYDLRTGADLVSRRIARGRTDRSREPHARQSVAHRGGGGFQWRWQPGCRVAGPG